MIWYLLYLKISLTKIKKGFEMNTIKKDKLVLLLTKLDTIAKRLDDRLVKGLAQSNDVRNTIKDIRHLRAEIQELISTE